MGSVPRIGVCGLYGPQPERGGGGRREGAAESAEWGRTCVRGTVRTFISGRAAGCEHRTSPRSFTSYSPQRRQTSSRRPRA